MRPRILALDEPSPELVERCTHAVPIWARSGHDLTGRAICITNNRTPAAWPTFGGVGVYVCD